MSKRAHMQAALERRAPTGPVPIWELEFQMWDQFSGRHVVLGHEFEALTPTEQERAMYANAEIIIAVAEKLHFAALTSPNGYWEQAPGQLAYYCLPGDTRYRQLEILRELAPKDLMLVGITGVILMANYSPEFCYRLIDEPEAVDGDARNMFEYGLAMTKRLRDCGADIVVTASDIADNNGPFFRQEYLERWILPNLSKWAEAVAGMGLYSILHSDGNLMPQLDAIANTGINGLQAIDPVAGMDMRKAKDLVGSRLCLCGNIDCGVLLRGKPADVFEATRRLLTTCKADGGFVLGASNAVQPEVPMDNYLAMIQAWEKFGQ